MSKSIRLAMAAVFVLSLFIYTYASETTKEEKNGMLRHVVSFKYKESATEDQIAEVNKAFADLENKIPAIVSIEMGTNVSPENLNKGFTHCYILTFKTAKDRDDYLVHPDHKAFGKQLGPVLDDVFVIDFWTK